MANMVPLEHPDFIEHKLGVYRSSILTYLLYDGEAFKPNEKGQVKVLDDHGRERTCQFENPSFLRLPKSLNIDGGEPIAFTLSTQIPLLAYPFLLLNLPFFALPFLLSGDTSNFKIHNSIVTVLKVVLSCGMFTISSLAILGCFGLGLSTVKKCLCSICIAALCYLLLGLAAYKTHLYRFIASLF